MGGIGWDLLAACSISLLRSSTAIYRTAFHVGTFQLNLYTINPKPSVEGCSDAHAHIIILGKCLHVVILIFLTGPLSA